MKNKKVIVLMGGPSSEREVSLNTGKGILAALIEKGYDAEALDIDPTCFSEQVKAKKADVVFNAIHGKYGEDGYVQGALEMMGVPYTGSGVLASAMAMDKAVTKKIFRQEGIATARAAIYKKNEMNGDLPKRIMNEFSFPVVVKATAQGSTIGVSIVENVGELAPAIEDSFSYGPEILVESFIQGRELAVAVWGGEALPIVEIAPHSGKYDYASKYTKGATDYTVPAPIGDAATKAAQEMAVRAYGALGCQGMARVDLILSEDGTPYVLEVNTVPGMTATSLVPKAAGAVGISFPELCEKILLMAVAK